MHTEEGCGEVAHGEEVQGAGEGDAGDAVERRGDPCDLGLVDGEVGGYGAVEALADEDFQAVVVGELGCFCGVGCGGAVEGERSVVSRGFSSSYTGLRCFFSVLWLLFEGRDEWTRIERVEEAEHTGVGGVTRLET